MSLTRRSNMVQLPLTSISGLFVEAWKYSSLFGAGCPLPFDPIERIGNARLLVHGVCTLELPKSELTFRKFCHTRWPGIVSACDAGWLTALAGQLSATNICHAMLSNGVCTSSAGDVGGDLKRPTYPKPGLWIEGSGPIYAARIGQGVFVPLAQYCGVGTYWP